MPDINIHEEMVDMIAASRSYEANLAVVKNARSHGHPGRSAIGKHSNQPRLMDALSALKMVGRSRHGKPTGLTPPRTGRPPPQESIHPGPADNCPANSDMALASPSAASPSRQRLLFQCAGRIRQGSSPTNRPPPASAVSGLLSGKNVSLHQTMISMEEANVSFQIMVEVRNRLLDSYQELMRMQV